MRPIAGAKWKQTRGLAHPTRFGGGRATGWWKWFEIEQVSRHHLPVLPGASPMLYHDPAKPLDRGSPARRSPVIRRWRKGIGCFRPRGKWNVAKMLHLRLPKYQFPENRVEWCKSKKLNSRTHLRSNCYKLACKTALAAMRETPAKTVPFEEAATGLAFIFCLAGCRWWYFDFRFHFICRSIRISGTGSACGRERRWVIACLVNVRAERWRLNFERRSLSAHNHTKQFVN